MNALIEQAAGQVVALFHRVTLPQARRLTSQQLNDLEHECEEQERNEDYPTRTGAHIARAAVKQVLEERKGN